MSKAFAEEILNTPDEQLRKGLLQRRPNEVDDAFTQHFLRTASTLTDTGDHDAAVATMRVLYSCGTICQRPVLRTRALWAVAGVEIARAKGSEAMKRLTSCLDECSKAPDQCAQVELDALDLLATLQFEHEYAPDKAIDTLKLALFKARTLKDAERINMLQSRIDELTRRKAAVRDSQPFAVLLQDMRDTRTRLAALQKETDALSSQLDANRAEVAGFDGQRAALTTQLARLQTQVDALTATRDELQSRHRLFATALAAPLWIAAVRADIQAGSISELTLPLLERLRSAIPEYAAPLITQIRARNGIAPERPINLDGLAGEERLFAAVANSLTLDPATDPAAFETLLDAWETYLSTPAGNGP